MRKEMNETVLNEVAGGAVSNLLYRSDRKATLETAVLDSSRKANAVPLTLGRKSSGVKRIGC